MTDKFNTPHQFHSQDNNATCQEHLSLGEVTYTCDLPKGHTTPEHKSFDYHVNEDGENLRVAVIWMKINKT